MNNTIFILGNGFDLAIGKKTAYTDFYDWYKKRVLDNVDANILMHELAGDLATWADFEISISDYISHCNNVDKYLKSFGCIVKQLNNYLKKECVLVDWEKVHKDDSIIQEFAQSLQSFETHIPTLETPTRFNIQNDKRMQFFLLNYTDTFDKLLKIAISQNSVLEDTTSGSTWLHGKVDEYPTTGIGTIEQVINETLRDNEKINKVLVKSEYRRIVERSDSGSLPYDSFRRKIRDASMVCIYGSSIAETDQPLWEIVSQWFFGNPRAQLVIFVYDEKIPIDTEVNWNESTEFAAREQKNLKKVQDMFFQRAKQHVCENDEEKLKNFHVVMNAPLFNFKLPRKAE